MVSFDKAAGLPPASDSTGQSARDNVVDLVANPASRQGPCAQYARPYYQVGKRLFDLIVATIALILLFPLFVLVYIAVAITSGFPATFKHIRVGQHGKHFAMYKFRSMVKNADQILRDRPELMEEYQRTYKITNDPRVSKLGHILRRTTLDELPQLLNVILGHMSLVGPRPVVPPELEKFGDDKDIYLYMKPGCAGLWQCSGRSDLTYDERIRLDLMYCKKASLRYDFRILCRTFLAIVLRRGAA